MASWREVRADFYMIYKIEQDSQDFELVDEGALGLRVEVRKGGGKGNKYS
jgi:hypothetical protein